MKAREADVYRGAEWVGRIARTKHGAVFEYDRSFLERAHDEEGIAIHLPYAARRFETTGVNLHTYFAGLLPEGLRLRALVRNLKTSEDDLLSLLVAAGADCIGDVSVVARDEPLAESAPAVDVAALGDLRFRELFEQSLAPAKGRPQPTIPGIQDKVSASMISFPLRAKGKRAFILKLNPADKPRLVENERFFMRMAKDCGLSTAVADLVHDKDGESGLLVERFDREVDGTKLHQEDACQLLDRYPADKYRLTCADVARGLSVCAAPVVEVARFLRFIAFSYVIANGDLHAKNVSVLRSPATGQLSLSPVYDMLSTLPYGDRRMAMGFEGRDENLKRRHFLAFGARHGVREKATGAMLDEIAERARPWIERVEEIGLEARQAAHLRRIMMKRAADLAV